VKWKLALASYPKVCYGFSNEQIEEVHNNMRMELKFGLLCNAFSIILGRFPIIPHPLSDFLGGVSLAAGIFLLTISVLPKGVYDKLLYRKCITNRLSK
jgi:hypothetical protein